MYGSLVFKTRIEFNSPTLILDAGEFSHEIYNLKNKCFRESKR